MPSIKPVTMESIQEAVTQIREAQRTILCRPDDVAAIQEAVDSVGATGWVHVQPSRMVKPGTAIITSSATLERMTQGAVISADGPVLDIPAPEVVRRPWSDTESVQGVPLPDEDLRAPE